MRGSLAVLAAVTITACAPVSPELAARQCEDRARAAVKPVSGTAAVGIGSDGPITDVDVNITITSDYIQGRDPYVVYDQCVRELSGQGPIRPLIL